VKRDRGGHEQATFKELMFMSLAVLVGVSAAGGIMVCRSSLAPSPQTRPNTLFQIFIAWYMGARFDLAWQRGLEGKFSKPGKEELASLIAESAKKASATVTKVVKETMQRDL